MHRTFGRHIVHPTVDHGIVLLFGHLCRAKIFSILIAFLPVLQWRRRCFSRRYFFCSILTPDIFSDLADHFLRETNSRIFGSYLSIAVQNHIRSIFAKLLALHQKEMLSVDPDLIRSQEVPVPSFDLIICRINGQKSSGFLEMIDVLCGDMYRKNLVSRVFTWWVSFDWKSLEECPNYDGPLSIDFYGRLHALPLCI